MSQFDDQIDLLCDRFEDAWIAGNRPSITEVMAESNPATHQALLENLVPTDIEYRIKLGEAIDPGDYSELGPQAIAIAQSELDRNPANLNESNLKIDSDDDKPVVPIDVTGTQIGPYRLVRKIGEGGMGSV